MGGVQNILDYIALKGWCRIPDAGCRIINGVAEEGGQSPEVCRIPDTGCRMMDRVGERRGLVGSRLRRSTSNQKPETSSVRADALRFTMTIFILSLIIGCTTHPPPNPNPLSRQELHRDWEFRMVGDEKWLPATVPGVVHTDLLNGGVIEDPFYRTNEKDLQWIGEEDWEYRTEFTVEEPLFNMDHVELVLEGLDTYADVYLNDSLVLSADNMFLEWQVDCKSILIQGANEMRVVFKSPVESAMSKWEALPYRLPASNDGGEEQVSVFTRKAPYHYGWDWAPRLLTSGIWRPVYLEAWDHARIKDVQVIQKSITEKEAQYDIVFEVESDGSEKEMELFVGGTSKSVLVKEGTNFETVSFVIKDPKLWWTNGLGEQNLYNLNCSLKLRGKVIDREDKRIGVRTLELVRQKDTIGESFFFKLNGQPVFMKGANYIPQDVFLPRVSRDQYRHLIESAAECNMNMIRVWGGGIYERDMFYDLCDEYGILVWQDFMFACSMYPGDADFLSSVEKEVSQQVKRLRNHPSLALWCGNNEVDVAWHNWGWQKQYEINSVDSAKIWADYLNLFEELIPKVVSRLNPHTAYIIQDILHTTHLMIPHHIHKHLNCRHNRKLRFHVRLLRLLYRFSCFCFPYRRWHLISHLITNSFHSHLGDG